MSKFFSNSMHCLYLDQFVVSYMCDTSPNEKWAYITDLIRLGVKNKQLICPASVEHMIETSGKDRERAELHDKELRKLSCGWHFYPEADISAHYLICRIRKIKISKNHFIRKEPTKHISDNTVHDSLRKLKQTFEEMGVEAMKSVNNIRRITRDGKKGNKALRDSLVAIIKDHLIERMLLLGLKGSYRPKLITLAGFTIPFWADTLCSILVGKHKMTQKEALKAVEILENDGIEAIPPISIRASLEAMLAFKNANETSRDHIDIMRISGALPFADLMLIDGPKAHDVQELAIDQKYQTAVFSGRREDLEGLTEKLKKIVKG